ncbi:MAG: hypothetical protein HPY45_08960 [Anaerolineae bacterium]|nr:hypothetical protein [Anaerolineae bacterium]
MLNVIELDTTSKPQVNEFVNYPFKLYANCPQWVPPIIGDVKKMLNPKQHPLYEHSDATFFLARRNGEVVGRIAVMENKPYNRVHDSRTAFFSLFECNDDQEAANSLFERVFDWAHQRKLNKVVGTKGFGAFDGYGILIEGFEHRAMMTMVPYNYPYYSRLLETLGFEKEVDFVSCMLTKENLSLPEKVHRVAERVKQRKSFEVINLQNRGDLKKWARRIGEAYNKTFINNWEYYPISDREIDQLVSDLLTIADPHLMKVIARNNEVVGFLMAFADITPALQRMRGRITPWAIVDLLLERQRAKWVTFNGMGVLPEYQGLGSTALMYTEVEKTIKKYKFDYVDMPQVAETATQMRKELVNLGGKEYRNHRVYRKLI